MDLKGGGKVPRPVQIILIDCNLRAGEVNYIWKLECYVSVLQWKKLDLQLLYLSRQTK